MAYGLKIWDASSSVIFDSSTQLGGWVAGVVVGTTSSFSVSYPDFAGRAGFTVVSGPGGDVTWDYTLGYPRVTIPGYAYAGSYRTVYVNMVK